jgi:hypothetical protein
VCIFKSRTGYNDDGGYATKSVCFNNNNNNNNNKRKKQLIMVILNCILLHSQTDGFQNAVASLHALPSGDIQRSDYCPMFCHAERTSHMA